MARPKRLSENRVTTAVRIPHDLHERLVKTADERGTSVSHLLLLGAERLLDRLPPLEAVEGREVEAGKSSEVA
jgi:hypothetical protein